MSNVVLERPTLSTSFGLHGKVSYEDREAKKALAAMFLRTNIHAPTRKFGFWWSIQENHLPMPVKKTGGETDRLLFEKLREIQAYAGYLDMKRTSHCRLCNNSGNGWAEFIFRATPNGVLYRWPEGLMHYHDCHSIAAPMWLTELVAEFNAARATGLWKG
jgi:hypothetical protein